MKKATILAALAASFLLPAAAAANAADASKARFAELKNQVSYNGNFCKAIPVDEWKAYADEVVELAATNKTRAADMFSRAFQKVNNSLAVCVAFYVGPVDPNYVAGLDERAAAAGLAAHIELIAHFPKCVDNYIAQNPDWAAKHPALIAAGKRRGGPFWDRGPLTFGERLNIFAENVATGVMSEQKKQLLASGAAMVLIRRRLRTQGVSFVAENGKENPVQEPLDRLAAALDAPCMKGLKEWAAEFSPETKWIDVKWLSPAELETLMDKIYYGEIPVANYSTTLLGNLGVAEYNNFVKRYNGTVDAKE